MFKRIETDRQVFEIGEMPKYRCIKKALTKTED